MKPQLAKGVNMSIAKQVQYGVGGFMLSLVTILSTAIVLQFVFSTVVTIPENFLVAYGTTLANLVTAVGSSWACLLLALRNKAMIRGVWFQIYTFVGIGIIGLTVAVFS
jgi:hypothetical protein